MRKLFYRSFGGYPWPENTKFGYATSNLRQVFPSLHIHFLLTHITFHIARVTLYPCLLAFSFFAASAFVVKVEIPIFLFSARTHFCVISTLSSAAVCCVLFGGVVCRSRVYHAFSYERRTLYHPFPFSLLSACGGV